MNSDRHVMHWVNCISQLKLETESTDLSAGLVHSIYRCWMSGGWEENNLEGLWPHKAPDPKLVFIYVETWREQEKPLSCQTPSGWNNICNCFHSKHWVSECLWKHVCMPQGMLEGRRGLLPAVVYHVFTLTSWVLCKWLITAFRGMPCAAGSADVPSYEHHRHTVSAECCMSIVTVCVYLKG